MGGDSPADLVVSERHVTSLATFGSNAPCQNRSVSRRVSPAQVILAVLVLAVVALVVLTSLRRVQG